MQGCQFHQYITGRPDYTDRPSCPLFWSHPVNRGPSKSLQQPVGSRRRFLQTAGCLSLLVPAAAQSALRSISAPVKLGMITDLHQDIMHDGQQRLDTFLTAMEQEAPDALVQLGDFAVPKKSNQPLIDSFNAAHSKCLHVLGNHDVDGGFSWQQTMDAWGLEQRYYSRDIGGLRIVVLDGNEPPPDHAGGYPSHVGPEQLEWLRATLQEHSGPCLVLCHQPLAGPWAVDNAEEVQRILNAASDRGLLSVNGHSHIDYLVRAGNIGCLHLNSASYVWVGGQFQHRSYSEDIHANHPRMASTCPYRDALFTVLTVDPESGTINVQGRDSQWVGPSPAELGRDKHPDLIDGEQIAPRIRPRQITRITATS